MGSLLGNIPQQTTNQPQAGAGGDLLSTLLGGMGGAHTQQQPQQDAGGDLLSTLLGGMGGAQSQQQPQQQAGGDLLSTLLGGLLASKKTTLRIGRSFWRLTMPSRL